MGKVFFLLLSWEEMLLNSENALPTAPLPTQILMGTISPLSIQGAQ